MKADELNGVKITITAIVTVLAARLGILAVPVFLLFVLNITDYITAIMAAPCRGEGVRSDRGLAGIKKKISMYILVCLGAVVDVLLTHSAGAAGIAVPEEWIFAFLVAVWLNCNEVISILENLLDMNVQIPPFLLPLTKRIKSTIASRGGAEGGAEGGEEGRQS